MLDLNVYGVALYRRMSFYPLLSWAAAAAYAALAVRGWRLTRQGVVWQHWRSWVLLPLLVHAGALSHSIFTGQQFNLGLGNTVSAIGWLVVLVPWLAGGRYALASLSWLVLPVAGVASVLGLLPVAHWFSYPLNSAFGWHLPLALLAYSLFVIAALYGLLLQMLTRALHHPIQAVWAQHLPPLLTIEALLFRTLSVGFFLLTLTLATGVAFSAAWFGHAWGWTHKTVFGVLSWLIFAALLWGRYRHGWRGRVALRWLWAGCASLLLAYVGSKFVLEVILQRLS